MMDPRLATVWSDATSTYMRTAMAMSLANMDAMAGFWSVAGGSSRDAPAPRRSTSTVMPWHRSPERERNPFDLAAWLPAPPPAQAPTPMFAFPSMGLPGFWMPGLSQSGRTLASNRSAAMPALLGMVALGMAAQSAIAMIEATHGWEAAAVQPPSWPMPSYRSDSGHAVAAITMPEAASAATTLPMTGMAMMLQMMKMMTPR